MQEKVQKISPIKQRILQFIKYLGISKREFYRKIEVSRGTLENNTGITEDILARFIAIYPNVRLEWLLNGNGEMLKKEDECLTVMQEKVQKILSTQEKNVGIPLIPLSAMAGALTGEQEVLEYECERYVIPAFNGADFLIPVKGNSMFPTYVSGDIVACQRVSMTDIFFQWNKTYVLDTNQGALIKRIKPGHDKQHILIVSDNTDYDPFELSYSDIHAVAMVIGIIRLE